MGGDILLLFGNVVKNNLGEKKEAAATEEYQADAFIEWGGAYDHRRLTLDEHKGVYGWTDWDASNELNLGDQVGGWSSMEEAKSKLEQFVFRLGEPRTYIHFPEGPVEKRNYLQPGEKQFLKDVGVSEDIKPDYSDSSDTAAASFICRIKAKRRSHLDRE